MIPMWKKIKDWLFGKRIDARTPEMFVFEGLIREAGGRVFPYIGLINPGSGDWVFNESQRDFLKIISFDYNQGQEVGMVQRTGNVYYYLAVNGACFRCTI